ncbi:MAG: IS1634 family transposase, partial [Actinobacteria bacterium]|nr:IS1634 family transposase [Actinomycetota bacterium]
KALQRKDYKRKKGHPYYYAVESKRVNGQPRIVWQKYLGTVDNILKRMKQTEPKLPREAVIFEAGAVAALLSIAQQIGLVDIINTYVPKRQSGPSVGHYILLAAINRVLDPTSKVQIGKWYDSTILRRLWGYPKSVFNSQRFWDHMDMVSEEDINQVQKKLIPCIVNKFGIETDVLLYDTTNFFTFIASTNRRNSLAQRGRSKAKRDDLRQVGFALIASSEFQVPLLHQVYQGNITDLTLFPEVVRSLTTQYSKLVKNAKETTLVCDRGNFSQQAMEQFAVYDVHFVTGLPSNYLPDMIETATDKLLPLNELPGTRALSFPIELWSKDCNVIVNYSESFFTQQLNCFTTTLIKCQKQLSDLQKELERRQTGKVRGTRYTVQSVCKEVENILSKQFVKDVIKTKVYQDNEHPRIQYHLDHNAFKELTTHRLGKILLITDHLDWPVEQVIKTYRSLVQIEDVFKNMKNTDFLRWQPAFHWTDQKLRVYGFYCVLGFMLVSLMRKLVFEAGIEYSIPKLLNELNEIKQVALIYPPGSQKKGKDRLTHSKMSPRQLKLATILEIEKIML